MRFVLRLGERLQGETVKMWKRPASAWTRREFLLGTASAGLLLTSSQGLGGELPSQDPESSAAPPSSGIDALKHVFLNPPHAAKPMTRWWWFGGAVTPEEITRELTLMRDAGLRGIELQPVYPLAVDDPKRGIRNVRYFTPEWFDLLRHTLRETQRLGLQFDFTLGSGWPFGGPFIPGRLAAKRIGVLTRDAAGLAEFSWDLEPYLTGGGRAFAIVAAPVESTGNVDVSRSRVISGGRRRGGKIRWSVPEGRWKMMVFTDNLTGQQVKRPTIGMEGYVIDHFSREALDLFLDAVGARTVKELQPAADPPFSSVFCDSLEVFGADWTPHFMREFQKRRGYDLTSYLPALWENAGPVTPHVRYDYHQTLSDLMMDNFFAPMSEWSRNRKMTARVQAHGAMGDVMRGYGLADIPEGEEGTDADQYSVIIDHRRLASSAGHIYQKPVISCESYTWLRVPLFTVTLEMMKGATDSSFLDGVNQIVNQGYSYSPPGVGWVFYASTMVNHNNIWWRHYKYLAGYIQRTAALLLQGVSVNPIAIYVPLADIYAQYGLGSLTIDTEIQKRLGPEIFQDLRRAGYDFDLINDDALARIATVQDGTLRAGTAAYSVVIVPDVEFMPPESLGRLAEFAQSGGLLIFMERLPESAPGVKDQKSRAAQLHEILHSIWTSGQPAMNSSQDAGKGRAILAADRAAALKAIEAELTSDFKIVAAGDSNNKARQDAVENVGFAHRRDGETDFYFLSNISQIPQDLRIQFHVGHRAPQRWNPEAHTIEETLVFDYVDLPRAKVTEVQIHLDPMDSCFIVFGVATEHPLLTGTDCAGPLRIEAVGKRTYVTGLASQNGRYFFTDGKGRTHRFAVKDLPERIAVKGPWKLTLSGQPAVTLNDLQSWGELPQGKTYSGWGTYETTFEAAGVQNGVEWLIDLGSVHETAEVFLNNVDLGAAWKGLRRLPCGDALRKGSNRLKVEVGNLWIQRAQSLIKTDFKAVAETFGIRWGTYGERKLRRLPPAGLLGPVRLLPRKRFSLAI